jgi:hypothetical protein
MPSWKREDREIRADLWIGRGWYGIEPADRVFLFWGHAHLLGSGWRGWLKGKVRGAKDKLQN